MTRGVCTITSVDISWQQFRMIYAIDKRYLNLALGLKNSHVLQISWSILVIRK